MKAIISKQSTACSHPEQKKTRAKFKDLVDFMERLATVVLNLMFGNIQDTPTLIKRIKIKQCENKHQFKSGGKGSSSFATIVIPGVENTTKE